MNYNFEFQVPFGTMVALICMWFGISLPLVFLGYYFGFRKVVCISFIQTHLLNTVLWAIYPVILYFVQHTNYNGLCFLCWHFVLYFSHMSTQYVPTKSQDKYQNKPGTSALSLGKYTYTLSFIDKYQNKPGTSALSLCKYTYTLIHRQVPEQAWYLSPVFG